MNGQGDVVTPKRGAGKKRSARSMRTSLILAAVIVAAVVGLLIAFPPFVTVPAGHTGVVVTFGKVADYTLDEGFHLKNPVQEVVLMDNRAQKAQLNMQAFSSDIQQVDIDCSVNYAIDRETAQTLYKTVGRSYYTTVMEPRIQENVKSVFSRYSAEKLIQVRDSLSKDIKSMLEPEMKAYGIQIISIAIEDVDFSDAFTDAVEAKQVAEQTKLKVETEQAQQVSVEKATAERRIISANADAQERSILAEADAEVARIEADANAYARQVQAEAEAEANAKIAASITDALIRYLSIEQWDGKLPQIFGSEGLLPIIDMSVSSFAGSDSGAAASSAAKLRDLLD